MQTKFRFKGTWRKYQARVLNNANRYLKDGKIHIVAAPGSGKTTLGIELITRLNAPALILTPSVTIREQWEGRIVDAFLNDGLNPADYISQNLKEPSLITIGTYQALHSAMNHYKGVLDEDGEAVDTVDYSDFDIISTMQKTGIKTICLDECHHLRTEWWKALEEFKQSFTDIKMICLTGTPPYDSTPALWKRYMDMCGEIDEEIAIPELVKEGSLCPHQDYVYFNYPTDEEIEEIKKSGKNQDTDKILLTSKAKTNSIKEIAKAEVKGFGDNLRMLILTDYIRKECENDLGTENEINLVGVLPYFEMLRREPEISQNARLGVLCGTIVIIPSNAKDALNLAIGDSGKVNYSGIGMIADTEYIKVTAVGDSHFLTGAVTEIFTKGFIKILVGTKSLLGEGWDAPCINSLILASFVGSYMLSNQMRGRAIRVFKDNPEKTSNIWHLVSLLPDEYADNATEANGDYGLLERRMDNFLGLHYENDTIENGMSRLSFISPPFNPKKVEEINSKMLEMSCERESLRTRWLNALDLSKKMEVAEEVSVQQKAISESEYKSSKTKRNIAIGGFVAGAALTALFAPIGIAAMTASAFYGLFNMPKYNKVKTPTARMQNIGEGILFCLKNHKLLEERQGKVITSEGKDNKQIIYLQSSSGRDKLLFANCVTQFFSPIDDQRYILAKKGQRNESDAYYSVPDVFAKNKEDAEHFYTQIKNYIGQYELIYTRNDKGKKILELARQKSLKDNEQRSTTKKVMH